MKLKASFSKRAFDQKNGKKIGYQTDLNVSTISAFQKFFVFFGSKFLSHA